MPTYDYACSACGHRFERFESMSAGGLKTCEKCGKKKVRRVLLKPCATYNSYSPCHPRKNRGSGIGRKGV